ncbi:hypothetical protein Desor_1415 [Desulfosporosinus orientis DSM 765]|uniref:Uncharacterized protein n=1 Tax=Desulfosporosinus orientis (strain ATCC 19365 / DSM 765 / NCIMB 8382 / VKM B-1628 / Singapore I) TaxID=768706 RepID=G7W8D3_DESOD|nr:hypothetical protein [Desulfosporosinus orientis]AET67073.1 hypothetical protein Desor_1415 [Desulfosporosinus orientis DSM 765]
MSYQFYTLPQNTSGAADIPIFNTPTTLASLTVAAGSGSDIATVRANIGWQAQSGGNVIQVLFKIWRGAPITGELVCSVQDSAESAFDYVATTDFSEVVSGLTSNQPVTFVLTAETVGTNTLAKVIGPLTFTALDINSDLLSYFELPNNTFGGANIPVAQAPVPVAVINVNVEPGQNVILRPTACWISTRSIFPKVDVLFKLWRGAPITGTLIASADDSADVERGAVTSFSHVDSGFTSAQIVTYVLTAEAPDPSYTASIVGALIITGSAQTLSSFFTLPQNTSGSVSIPITSADTPLAAITAESSPGLKFSLRAAIGWLVPSGSITPIIFKIWRGAPNTGTLIYSALDSGESPYDYRKVTALAHVDSGFTASGLVTYTLTAELTKPGTAANVVGPLTFTAIPES